MWWLGLSAGLKSSGVAGAISIGGGYGLIPRGAVIASILRPEMELIPTSIVRKGDY